MPNLLLQKTPSDNFTATMKLTFRPNPKYKGERTGLVVMGMDYAGLILENTEQGTVLSQIACRKADRGGTEKTNDSVAVKDSTLYLRVKFSADGSKVKGTDDLLVRSNFSYSLDGKKFRPLGETFQAREGKWYPPRYPHQRRRLDGCRLVPYHKKINVDIKTLSKHTEKTTIFI